MTALLSILLDCPDLTSRCKEDLRRGEDDMNLMRSRRYCPRPRITEAIAWDLGAVDMYDYLHGDVTNRPLHTSHIDDWRWWSAETDECPDCECHPEGICNNCRHQYNIENAPDQDEL